ncbi:MAG: S49 family peptidase [Actinobacteria bacterium]|nr:S49 family peptidase [Actinomycetota bacterium]
MCFRIRPTVAVLNLTGVVSASRVGGGSATLNVRTLEKVFKKVEEMPRVDAIALAINCPGGSPVQTELIYQKIRWLAAEKEVPVLAFVEDCAASGGYWLALAGDTIYASRASMVGSIGVIAGGFGFVEAMGKLGVERRVYACGDNKALLDPFQPEKASDRAILESAMKDVFVQFCQQVKDRRPKVTDDSLFTGAVWSGSKAVELGLVDEIGSMYDVLRKRFGKEVRIKEVEPDKSLVEKLLGVEGGGGAINAMFAAAMNTLESRVSWGRLGM